MLAGLNVGRLAANVLGFALIAVVVLVIAFAIFGKALWVGAEELADAAKNRRGLF